jgi:HK97 family phage major capsid protein
VADIRTRWGFFSDSILSDKGVKEIVEDSTEVVEPTLFLDEVQNLMTYAAHNDLYGMVLTDPCANERPLINNEIYSLFLDICTVVDATGKRELDFNINVEDLENLDPSWSLEMIAPGSYPVINTPQITKKSMSLYTIDFALPLTRKFTDTAQIDVEQFVRNKALVAIYRDFDEACVNGDGASRPAGIRSAYAFGTDKNDLDKIFQIKTGSNDASYEALISAIFSLDMQFRKNASWLMHPETLAAIRKLKVNNSFVFPADEPSGRAHEQLMGYPVHFTEELPLPSGTPTPGIIYFGDFKKCYVAIGKPLTIEVDNFSMRPLNSFYCEWRGGFLIPDCRCLRAISTGAAE